MAKKGIAKGSAAKRGEPATGKGQLALPKGFKRRKAIPAPDAHMMVATSSASMGPPPYICVPTGPPPYPCLRYGLDPNTGQYSIPPNGEPMDCATCRGGS
jgi:hypothetical protein